MATSDTARRLAIAGAVLMTLTALAHTLGYFALRPELTRIPDDLRPLLPVLWFGAGVDFAIVAALVWRVTLRPSVDTRLLLAAAATQPLGVALLQLAFLGVSPPTVMLSIDALLLLAAALMWPARA